MTELSSIVWFLYDEMFL